MKKFLVSVLFLVISVSLYGQESAEGYNFFYINNDIAWQKVFECEKPSSEVIAFFKSIPNTTVSVENDNQIAFSREKEKIFIKKHNQKSMMTPALISFPLNYHAAIDVKDGKYRVTVSHVCFISNLNFALGGVSTNSNTAVWLTESYYDIKKERFRSSFYKTTNAAHVLNSYFNDIFTVTQNPVINDW